MTNKKSMKKMIQTALLIAVMTVMATVPFLGYIPVTPAIQATTIHIPVIIGAILMGPKTGALLGGYFGLTSLIVNTFRPTATSFVFTPFYSLGEASGNIWSLVICFVPRILIGIVAGLVYNAVQKIDKTKVAACILSGLAGSITNTILVMSGIYVFFGNEYSQAKGIAYDTLLGVIGGVIAVNGVLEAIIAAVIATLVARPLIEILGKQK